MAELSHLLQTFQQRIEIDSAVLYAILARGWSFAAGPVTALFIASRFSPEIQGFYYTFGPILALQTFAELGIGLAITQFASHEWSKLKIGENGKIEGNSNSLSRLVCLVWISLKWYTVAAIIIIIGLSTGGYLFFSQSQTSDVQWQLPWISLCVLSGINLFSIGIWSLLEGCNQVSNVYFYRLFQGILGSAAAWIAILLGADLWTASIVTASGLIYGGFFLFKHYRKFLNSLLLKTTVGPRLFWRRDLLPFQWRIMVSWISGYFAFSLFTPILFHYHGPVVAGQMGMTWSLYNALTSLGSAWIMPKVPLFGMMAAQKKYAEMDRLFWRLMVIATGVTILGALFIWLAVLYLNHYGFALAQRMLSPLPTALFLTIAVFNTASLPMSTYLRAHKKHPLVYTSVLFGCLVALSNWFLGKRYAAVGMAAGCAFIYTMIFPITVVIWKHCRSRWHSISKPI